MRFSYYFTIGKQNRKAEIVLLHEGLHLVQSHIDIDGQDLEAAVSVVGVETLNVRERLRAGIAPRGPEIEEDDFAAVGAELHLVPA